MNRRSFLGQGSATVAAAAVAGSLVTAPRAQAKNLANDRISVAVVGVRGRGNSLLKTFAAIPYVDVRYVCDVDQTVLAQRLAETNSGDKHRAEGIKDFRRALDDKSVDAIVLGTPDHWHAIPTILGCQAGKDVYVEKPDGHNIVEGQTMVAAARRHKRVVQLGTQARSKPGFHKAMEYIKAGHLGRALYAKAWESSLQKSIGHPADGEAPAGVDYDLWLGPAPKRPFNPARFHGNWRWFFDYGTGDLGNDGVHRLDMARWGLETAIAASGEKPLEAIPRTVSSVGGKYYFDDDQQWPDTLAVSYDYVGRVLTYEMHVWSRYTLDGETEGAAVYGDNGYIVLGNEGWKAYGIKNKLLVEHKFEPNEGQREHAENFLECMRTRGKPAADLETVGHPSSLMCHLGNVAFRVGRSVRFDLASYTFGNDAEANKYLTRPEYRAPWTLPKLAEV